MLHIVEKNLRRYFCFLFCFIFIFGVNFGFVNLPRVSAEDQNEVVKWGANVGNSLEITSVEPASVTGKVKYDTAAMKNVNAYVYPAATEEELINAINNATIAAADVVNSVAFSLDETSADWNVKANTARNNAQSATTLAAAGTATFNIANPIYNLATSTNPSNYNYYVAAYAAYTGYRATYTGTKNAAYAAYDAAYAAYAACAAAGEAAAAAAAKAAAMKAKTAKENNKTGDAAHYAYEAYDIYNTINDNNTLNKDAVDAAFNVVKTAYNYRGLSLPPSVLATPVEHWNNINSGEQIFEVNNLEPNKKYILAIDFEDEDNNPGYITMSFTTPIPINLQVIGIKSYYTGQPQELVTSFNFSDTNGEITDEGILGILKLNVYLRAQKRGGDSTNWYNLNNLSSLTGTAPGIYDFYYYVDSEAEGMSVYTVSA